MSTFVDTDVAIDVSWSREANMLSNDNRTNISQPYRLNNANEYRSDFHLISPSSRDSGNYSCSVIINPQNGYLYLTSSDEIDSNISVVVSGL